MTEKQEFFDQLYEDNHEISRRLRAPEGACRVKVLRARKKYKKFLEENL